MCTLATGWKIDWREARVSPTGRLLDDPGERRWGWTRVVAVGVGVCFRQSGRDIFSFLVNFLIGAE